MMFIVSYPLIVRRAVLKLKKPSPGLTRRLMNLNPSVNRRVIDREAALPHHFFEITIAESITQVPAYAEKDDFALVLTLFEWIGFGHSRLPV